MIWIEKLEKLSPCAEGLEWARQFPTAQEAWNACEQGEWLLWYAARVSLTPERHRLIVRAACQIALRALRYIPEGESRPQKAIDAAELWADKPSFKTASEAAWAARAAARAAWAAEAKIHAEIVRGLLTAPGEERRDEGRGR